MSRCECLYQLLRAGYGHVQQTEGAKGQNQMLIASQVEQEEGILAAPKVDEAAAGYRLCGKGGPWGGSLCAGADFLTIRIDRPTHRRSLGDVALARPQRAVESPAGG